MVHALEESWRVLRPAGVLIDLRPRAAHPAVEIVSETGARSAGHVDDSGHTVDDLAADEAIDQVVKRGLFEQHTVAQFKLSLYWPSLEALRAYAAERWGDRAKIPGDVWRRGERLTERAGGAVKVRLQRQMHLAVYGKRLFVRKRKT